MEHVLAPLFTVAQATVGGIGLLVVAPLFWTPFTRWRAEANPWKRTAWLLALTSPWVALAYWTAFNWHKDGTPYRAPAFAETFALATLGATLVLAGASVALNRGARRFFVGWSLVNGWFAAVGALLCIMATSGNWI